jgi:hypothetical protein
LGQIGRKFVMSENDFDISQIIDDEDEDFVAGIDVLTPSGAKVTVINQSEADYYDQVHKRYLADNKFKNVSDILELDRILVMELMCYRWGIWILAEEDYYGRKINPNEVQKSIENYSKEIRGIKKDLGIDKSTRDKDKGDSVAEYIQMLGIRAKEFGITRNFQAAKSIEMLMEVRSLITLYENSSASERKEFGASLENLIDWFKNRFDEFENLDKDLRKNQKTWIRDI